MTTRVTEMNAKITADTNNVLAGFEKVKRATQDIGRTAQQSTRTAGDAFDTLSGKADKVAQASSAVLNSMYALEAKGSARVLALGNAVGSVAGLLGPQGKMVQGFAIVGSAIAALFLQAKEKSRETTEAIEADLKRLVNAGDFSAVTARLREINEGTAGNNFEDGRIAIQRRIDALTLEANAVGKSARFYRERQDKIIAEKQQLALLTAEYDRFAKAVTSTANAPRTARTPQTITTTADSPDKVARQAEQAAEKLARLRTQVEALYDTLSGRNALQQAAADLLQLQRDLRATGASADEVRESFDKAFDAVFDADAKKSADATRKLQGALEDVNAPLEKQLQQWVRVKEARDAAAATNAQALADAEREVQALREGVEAYDQFLRKQAQEAAVRQVLAQAKEEGRQATAQELIDARTNAAYLFDAAQLARQLQAALQDSGAGKLANELAAVAESATQIATSLGEAGRNIAVVASIASPLFKGLGSLQGALGKRDADGKTIAGQSVSFTDALRGKNGQDSQAQAIAGALAVVGAVASIADALDLFGTQAAQKAREMADAAREFAKGLADFVAQANPTSGATEAIKNARRRAEELAKQAAAAGGGTFTFEGEGDLTASELRARVVALRAAADGFDKTSPKLATQLRTVADGFAELADGLDVVEAAAREQVLRNIEDLNVRKLIAAGSTEEAERVRQRLANQRELAEARRDETEEGKRYLDLLEDVIAAEEAMAEALERRADALQLLDDSLAILGGTPLENLRTTFATLAQLFPQFEGLLDGLDLSTGSGLAAAGDRLRDLFRDLTSDGVISDAERPIVDAIKRMLGSIENAIGDLTDPLASALDAFAVRVEVFGLDAKAQFDGLSEILRGAFPEIGELLDTAAGGDLESLRASIQDRIAALLEGGIDESEAPLLAALRQLLGTVVGQIDDAAREAEEAAAAAETARQERVARRDRTTNAEISLGGLTGVDAVRARARNAGASSPILASLLPLFDDTSAEGIGRTKDALFQLFRDIEAGRVPLEEFGDLTEEEIIARIIELSGNLDGLAESLEDAAKAAAEAAAAERQQTQDLRIRLARSRGEETRLAEFDDAARQEREAARAAGRSASFLAFLDQVLASERNKLIQDIAGAATSAAIEQQANEAAAQSAGRNNVGRVLGGVTDVSVQVQNGYLRLIAEATRTTAQYSGTMVALLNGLRGGGTIPIPSLPSAPAASASSAGLAGASIVINVGTPVVNTTNLPGSASAVGAQIGAAQGDAIVAAISQQLGLRVRAIGGRIR